MFPSICYYDKSEDWKTLECFARENNNSKPFYLFFSVLSFIFLIHAIISPPAVLLLYCNM